MRKQGKRLLTLGSFLGLVLFVWYADGLRASLHEVDITSRSPLFRIQLEEKIDDMEQTAPGIAPVGPAVPFAEPSEPPQEALIIFSEGVSGCAASACAASGCAGSACGASGCGGSGCAGSACVGSGCGGSACAGSACAGSACGGSVCVGSGCGTSGCVGSGCVGSGCVGSVCTGTGCVGSACQAGGCNSTAADHESDDELLSGLACPLIAPGRSAGRFTSLETARTTGGTEIRWIFSGAEAERFRIFWDPPQSGPVLVSQGTASTDRLMKVLVRQAEAPTPLIIEVIDTTGLSVRVELGSRTTTTERS